MNLSDRQWEQVGAGAGLVFVACLLVVLIAFPAPPDFDAGGREIAQYYRDEQGSIQAANVIAGVGLGFLLWFLASVRHALFSAEAGTGRLAVLGYGAGLVAVALVFVALIFSAAAAFRPDETSAELLRLMHDVSFGITFGFASLAFAVFFVATAKAAFRYGGLPEAAWLGGLALVAALLQFLAVPQMIEDSGAFSADGVFGYAGVIALLVWVLVASVLLIRDPGTTTLQRAATGARRRATRTTTRKR